MRIGLISDTHGLLRPQAVDALRGSDRILHAGDIGDPGILDALQALAPTTAVRGNNDDVPWARHLPDTATLQVEGVAIYMLHDLKTLARWPAPEGTDVIVAGHSHKPSVEARDRILYVNPGSAGRRRFSLPVSVALLEIEGPHARARIMRLPVD